jgi:hypothetical protein
MKIFCPDLDTQDANKKNLNPIIKYILQGNANSNLTLANGFADANMVTPAYMFSVYYNRKAGNTIADWARQAKQNRIKVFIWHKGDLNPVPIDNVIYLQTSVDRSKRGDIRVSVPFFNEDPIENIYNGIPNWHEYTNKPEIAFCGYADMNWLKIALGFLLLSKEKLLFKENINSYYPASLVPPVVFRNKVLKLLQNDGRLKADFIIRTKFNVGKKNLNYQYDSQDKMIRQFFNNMLDNQYVVCVRGFGNYSVRFFETMACGRIPLFVDTDTDLPGSNIIDYRQHVVWVPGKDLKHMGDILLEYHKNLDDAKIKAIQQSNRKLWLDRLSFNGFFSHFEEFIAPYL